MTHDGCLCSFLNLAYLRCVKRFWRMSSNGLYRASERHDAYDAGTIEAVSIYDKQHTAHNHTASLSLAKAAWKCVRSHLSVYVCVRVCLAVRALTFESLNPFTANPIKVLYFAYSSNPPFLMFDIQALWRSRLSARAPVYECQKLKMMG